MIEDLSRIRLETLEAVADVFRKADVADAEHLTHVLVAIRDLLSVRVPHAYQPKISPEIAVRALQRLLASARNLQSGLEREFLELLSEGGLDQEFRCQQPLPLEVAARDGDGRRSIVVTPDFVHRSLPYVVFLDGRAAHGDEVALVDDAEISTELSRRGFLVRRLRHHQLAPKYRGQTLATVERDLSYLTAEALKKGLV